MKTQERIAMLPDVQSRADSRDLHIDAVGIKGARSPITIQAGERLLPTIATFSMTVGLSAVKKGTHMSRFIELLEVQTRALDQREFKLFLFGMLAKLNACSGMIEMRFPYFVRKTAPPWCLPRSVRAKLEGPFGSLTLHNNHARPAIFIAGGIGITPFISILRQASRDQVPQHLILVYSSRRPEDAAFLAELHELEQHNRNFRLVATMTDMSRSDRRWPGRTGSIDPELMRRIGSELSAPIYYVAGPPPMVAALRELLNHVNVK